MQFKLLCEKMPSEGGIPEVNEYKGFVYDSETGKLWLSETEYVGLSPEGHLKEVSSKFDFTTPATITNKWANGLPGKSKNVKTLKIQMGMSCNYSCNYCSQRFVDRPEQGNPEQVDVLIDKLKASFNFNPLGKGLRIEFWGGEPFVYWKTMKPLAEKLRVIFPEATFSVITNGSLLTKTIVDWLDNMGFMVSMSHDGPGQSIRGPCPIEDGSEETKEAIKYIFDKLVPKGRFSFGAMLNKNNISRIAIQEWFVERFGDNVHIGEGGMIDAYDDDGMEMSLNTKEDHFEFRKLALQEITSPYNLNYGTIRNRLNQFVTLILTGKGIDSNQVQKCGMDSEDQIAIDMFGNVITCQNVSSVAMAPNGTSHHLGTIDKLEEVKLHSATHWTSRPHCQSCPVVQVCSGNCMFLQGDNWYKSCDSAYSDNIVILSCAILQLTGYVPVLIDNDHLPAHRRDIWGGILEHKEDKAKKSFPIKVVTK